MILRNPLPDHTLEALREVVDGTVEVEYTNEPVTPDYGD
jgi:hypothetical protein